MQIFFAVATPVKVWDSEGENTETRTLRGGIDVQRVFVEHDTAMLHFADGTVADSVPVRNFLGPVYLYEN